MKLDLVVLGSCIATAEGFFASGDGNNSAVYLSETIRRYAAATGDTIDPAVPLWDYLTLSHIP